ncbi:MAG: hypothetical protein BLITH_0229 [Brockia lithotrophica]|uniref:Uncharacterized protein n=1 Tax=Brockia lithotrophica TaxID=933949 RepID=A0A2T5GAD8_9BACL|nr:MAG: hypothetical protein BLITH_0229 [Brockia lithotrophica]
MQVGLAAKGPPLWMPGLRPRVLLIAFQNFVLEKGPRKRLVPRRGRWLAYRRSLS